MCSRHEAKSPGLATGALVSPLEKQSALSWLLPPNKDRDISPGSIPATGPLPQLATSRLAGSVQGPLTHSWRPPFGSKGSTASMNIVLRAHSALPFPAYITPCAGGGHLPPLTGPQFPPLQKKNRLKLNHLTALLEALPTRAGYQQCLLTDVWVGKRLGWDCPMAVN